MYVCAQLFISYVCMCSVIYKLCMYAELQIIYQVQRVIIVMYDGYLYLSYVCMCSVIYKLCTMLVIISYVCILSYL